MICSLPEDIPLNDALKALVVPSIKLLERGGLQTYFALTEQTEDFCGTILSVLGDHMGLCDAAGLKGPQCDHPSRYSLVTKTALDSLDDKQWRESNAATMWQDIEKHSTRQSRKSEMQARGLREKVN